MTDVLTLKEIETQFPDEWVLVDDPQTDDAFQVQRGRVVAHSKNRDEVYRRILTGPSRFAILYTGEMPEDAAIIL